MFGTFLGIYVDSWGRKTGVIIFCVLEVLCGHYERLYVCNIDVDCTQIVINLLEHVPSMPALMVGRVLGGLSTSLLFTAFESWMVSEHRKRGYDEDLLTGTFAIASAGNGIAAISAGVLAQVVSGKPTTRATRGHHNEYIS